MEQEKSAITENIKKSLRKITYKDKQIFYICLEIVSLYTYCSFLNEINIRESHLF